MSKLLALFPVLLALLPSAVSAPSAPDEGMWTFENPPLAILKERYDFEPDQAWFDHLRLSSVRLNSGGSGSFVSANGLVMTNHHVALESVQKLSEESTDLVKNGFYAPTREQELPCPDLEINVLISTEDVTARVQAADDAMDEMDKIEEEESNKTGLRCDVETMYQGGMYTVYRYQQYTDVRLVWSPELDVGFYGGDPDNFTYPRFNLDASFFRVYENGEPIESPAHLEWSDHGATDGELVFVSGNPGSTLRLDTMAQLETYRDVIYPMVLKGLTNRRTRILEYTSKGEEEQRRAKDELFGIENSLKALTGELEALRDDEIMADKAAKEAAFLETEAGQEVKDAFEQIVQTQQAFGMVYPTFALSAVQSRIFDLMMELVNYVTTPATNTGLRQTQELALFSAAPIYEDLERVLIASDLQEALDALGGDNPVVQAMLQGRSPQEQADYLVTNTGLTDLESRRQLATMDINGLLTSGEPLIQVLFELERSRMPMIQQSQAIRRVEEDLAERIAAARFKAYGKNTYPDATFTLRLSFGVVKGYEQGTREIPYKTTFGGLFDRHDSFDGREPYSLPQSMLDAREDLDMSTPLNFVCTADIIGGNSGSPVVNRDNQVVGLIFDGNIESLIGRFTYDERQARSVAVHSSGIIEALRVVYKAEGLVREILGN